MHSFYAKNLNKIGDLVSLERAESDHLFKTLRGRVGEVVKLLDGNGKVAMAKIIENQILKIEELQKLPPQNRTITLFVAAPRKQKLDQVLKQATELGVTAIGILHCDFSVALPDGSNRWEALLWESCKQSNNPFLPKILPVMKFDEAVKYVKTNSMVGIFGDIERQKENREKLTTANNVAFFVGPEGGFSEREFGILKSEEFIGLNLGPYILRLETAAICGIPLIRELGGF